MPSSKIFRSRWSALFWAGGILWTAYDVADSQSHAPPVPAKSTRAPADAPLTDAMGQPVASDDLSVLANAMR